MSPARRFPLQYPDLQQQFPLPGQERDLLRAPDAHVRRGLALLEEHEVLIGATVSRLAEALER